MESIRDFPCKFRGWKHHELRSFRGTELKYKVQILGDEWEHASQDGLVRGRQNMGMPTRNSYFLRQECGTTSTMHHVVMTILIPALFLVEGHQWNCTSLQFHEMSYLASINYSNITWLSKAVISPRTINCEFGRKYELMLCSLTVWKMRKK